MHIYEQDRKNTIANTNIIGLTLFPTALFISKIYKIWVYLLKTYYNIGTYINQLNYFLGIKLQIIIIIFIEDTMVVRPFFEGSDDIK